MGTLACFGGLHTLLLLTMTLMGLVFLCDLKGYSDVLRP